MLGMHLGIQREAAAPLSVTFEGKALVADSIFPSNSVLPLSLFFIFFNFFSFWVRETHVEYIYSIELQKRSL